MIVLEPLGFWTQVLLILSFLNFALNLRTILESRWIRNHVRHIEFHVCPDHEQFEELQARLQEAFEEHLRGSVEDEDDKLYTNAKIIEEWDNQ